MKKLFALLLATALLLAACNSTGTAVKTGESGFADDQELTYLYSSEITSLNYYTEGAAVTYTVVARLVDGLIEYDKYGVVKAAIAENWEMSDDGLVWTFHLRDDVTWVDYQGNYVADVTAHDFVAAAKYCLNKDNASYYSDFYSDYFVNAMEYYEFKDTSEDWDGEVIEDFELVGVKALDDYTLEYTLVEPIPYFLSMMNWVPFYPVYEPFLEEVGEDFGTANDKLLYCGAWVMSVWKPQNTREYVKNESYYLADEIFVTKRTDIYNAESSTLAPEMFVRGEVNYADITTAILDEWLGDPERSQYVRPDTAGYYSYFYAFNFDPQFDDEYEPENWRIAVNNANFRKAIFHAFNRLQAVTTSDPYTPKNNLISTITPQDFCDVDGLDYTQVGALAYITNEMPTYDVELAKEYRDAAKAELEEAGATFPVKILMPYNSSMTQWGERCQVVKQNLEGVLGTDFIEVVIYNAPATNFLGDNRRNGKFALMEVNWGPDYSDPETYSDPFRQAGTYNKPHMAEGYDDEDGNKIYTNLLNAAKAEKTDLTKRYELFAEAEAFLIEEAFVIPYIKSVSDWVASYLNPFDFNYSSGSVMSVSKMNNVRKLSSPINTEQYNELYEEWKVERAEALKAAAGK